MIEVTEARLWHCGELIRRLRHEHSVALVATGLNVHRELRRSFETSCYRRSLLIGDRLAGMWGVTGTVLAPFGFLWLLLSDEATRYPKAVVQIARRELATIMLSKTEVVTTVLGGDETALRFAIFLGFHVQHSGRGQRARSRWSRRDFFAYLANSPEHRTPVRGTFVIRLGYHPEHEHLEAA